MAMGKLTIEDDEGQKTVVPLVRDEYTIGRREGHTIRLTERNISRDHAKVRKTDGVWTIEDLGSYNGVFVNGHRLSEAQKLLTGDLILIGDYRIEAHDDEARAIPAAIAAPRSSPPVAISSRPAAPAAPPKDDLPHRLVVLIGDEAGRPFPLEKPHMTVGRGEDVDVRLNHTSVSRHHCAIDALDGGQFEVLDSGSANGIRVNGQEVKKALLAPGDTIELGDLILKYVPAGQTFVLDASAAEAARDLERRRTKGGGTTWASVGLAGVCAAIAGLVVATSGGSDG
ncbi:MAG: FHA domain-containing protein, partial [Myxococcales bacterium]|nr:FHA domain-containing protein [Myxococcales bacterium]